MDWKFVPRFGCRYLESSLRGDKPCSRNVEFLSAHRAQRCTARDSGDRGHHLRDGDGALPASQKRAQVFPSLKPNGLDAYGMANYRPISNLSFLSKIVEKYVSMQLIMHPEENSLLPAQQSGFRKYHSTESLLTRILADMFLAVDKGHVTLLALFDVSAAFDTVDHDILLERLETSFGVVGRSLSWLRAFLTGRSVSVVMGSFRSDWSGVVFGLPQGSILGPLLYILYTADLSMILSPLGVAAHQYADDTQAYVHGVASEAISLVEKMLLVSDVIGAWLSSNRLRLNPGKTQFIWVGGRVQLSKIDLSILLERFPGVLFSTTVRDLGVTLDQELTLSRHVGCVCRSCFYHLRQIRSVRRSLTFKAARTLMHCIVLYCICKFIDHRLVMVWFCWVASCSAHQSEALPVRETQREESSLERTKRRTWHTS